MESLESELRSVEELRKDLSAVIVVQEEKSHCEIVEHASLAGNIWDEWTENETVIDQPRITSLDTQKRESARTQLQQIYDSSRWYSAIYIAGKILGIGDKKLNDRLNFWVGDLKKQFNAEIVMQEEEKELVQESNDDISYTRGVPNYTEAVYNITKPKITKPDIEKRRKAKEDFDRLKTELKKDYNNFNLNFEQRKKIGCALGYSAPRIWAHEHPTAETLKGIAIAGTASGLAYSLIEYFSK